MSGNKIENFDCVATVEHIHEFLDGELETDLQIAMERHLESCSECALTLSQFRQIENAHQQLDAQLDLPPEAYWQQLPQQVMERVKAADRRRLLALPRLPRLKPAATPSLKVDKNQTEKLLHLPPNVRSFLRGPAKYALAMAAVAAFCFFMIRELRQKPYPLTTHEQTLQKARIETNAEPELSTEEASPSTQMRAPQVPTKALVTISEEEQPSSQASDKDKHSKEAKAKSGLATTGQSAGGQGIIPTSPSEVEKQELTAFSESIAATATQSHDTTLEHKPEISKPLSAPALAAESQRLETGKQMALSDVAALPNEQDLSAVNEPARQATMRISVGAMSKSEAKRATLSPETSRFSQTLWLAQHASNLTEREKLWRRFLASQPDSAYQELAIYHLAQTLAAASDSNSTPAQLEKNLAYFRENAAILQPMMSPKEFERELTRLQMLLQSRKSSTGKKP